MANLAKYVVALEANTREYVRKLDEANRKLDRFHRDQQRGLDKVKQAFVEFGKGLVGALSVRAIAQFTAASVRMADEIGKVSRAAGVTAETLQELRFAFDELGGVTEQQTDVALQRFNRTLGQAVNGGKQAQTAFKLLGVEWRDASGRVKQTESALDETLRALAGVDSEAQRAALAAKLFGDEVGPKLAAALNEGIAGLEKARAQIPGLIGNERVAEAEALNDAFARIAKTIGGTLRNAVIETAADLADILGLLDRGPAGDLAAELEAVERRVASLQGAAAAGSLGGNQVLLDQAIAERDRLRRELKLAERVPDFATRRRLIAERDARAAHLASLSEIQVSSAVREPPRDLMIENLRGAARESMEAFSDQIREANRSNAVGPFLPVVEAGKKAQEKLSDGFQSLGESIGRSLSDSLADAMLGIETNWSDMLKRMVAQAAASGLLNAIGGSATGAFGKFFSFLGFGGARANGGPVAGGNAYLVGERGPELFVPGVSGRIVPNGGISIGEINVDARGATDPAAVEAAVQRGVVAAVSIADARMDAKLFSLARPSIA